MPYRFKHHETVPQSVKRIAAEQLDCAIEMLEEKGSVSRKDTVHEVRKIIKKARALLRIVRDELGSFFQDENIRLRDVGRQLSELRDSGALIGTVDYLRNRRTGVTLRKSLAHVRKLFSQQERQRQEQASAQNLFPRLAVELRKVRRSIRYWSLDTVGFKAIAPGLQRTFRDGRKAFAVARRSGRIEDYHEWRKRVKDHWYQVRLLRKVWGEVMSGYEQSLKSLEDVLGEDINLSLLQNQVRQLPSQDSARLDLTSLQKSVEAARQDLRKRALEIGSKVYAQKPGELTRQLNRLWKAW